MIRSVLCDVRERKYELFGIGCYMFRVNRSHVVDGMHNFVDFTQQVF